MNSRFDKAKNGLAIIGLAVDLILKVRDNVRARRAARKARRAVKEIEREMVEDKSDE